MPTITKKKTKMIVKDGNGGLLQLLPETEVDAELDEESSNPVASSAVAESLSSIQSAASNMGAIKVMDEEPTALNTTEYTGETLFAWVQPPESWSITIDTNQYSISTVHIPFSLYECPNTSITIDWGDGTTNVHTSEDAVYNEYPQHSYSERGTYNITIESKDFNKIYIDTFYGDIEDNYVYGSSDYALSLKTVNSPLPKLAGVRLWNEQQNKAVNVDNSFEHLFYSCWVLESIPSDLFVFNSNATNFNECFNMCSSLQSIPAGLFDKNVTATDFSFCFDYCYSIASIPSGLFDKNVVATDFSGCFSDCNDIQSIPSGLFDKNVAATSFASCFAGCYEIASIPSGLFDNNTLVTDFGSCFYSCSSLQSIPTGLFDKNTAATSFSYCFSNCSSLTDFTLHIGSSLVSTCSSFVTKKTGTTRIIYVPSGSTTQTTFNSAASSQGLTIIGE